MNWNEYKFRCSSLGRIMTNSRTKEPLGETCKAHLLECWIKEKYGREKEIINRYLKKGLQVEEDSITLYSRAKKKFYKKNEERLNNDHITGLPDLYEGETIRTASLIIDLKSSWDIYTFFANLVKALNADYDYQLQGYMDLSGAPEARLVYCLVSTPDPLILDEMNKLKWKMGVADPENNEVFKQACEYLETAMKFDDIPLEDRYIEFIIPRDQKKIDAIHTRVEECREFLNKLKP